MSSTLQLQTNPKVMGAWVHISYYVPPTVDDAGNVDGDFDERATNKEGYTAFLLVEPLPVYLLIRATGYEDQQIGPIKMPHDDLIAVDLVPGSGTGPTPPTAMSQLHIDGYYFANTEGRIQLNGASSFLAYKKFLDGGDVAIRPILAELQLLGFNAIRLFGMVNSFSHWYPQEYGDRYYDSIPAFLDVCAEYNLYVYWCAFADTKIVMPNTDDQQRHWQRTCEQLRTRPNALVEKGNEINQHDNGVDADLPKPDGLLSCSGSNGSNPDSLHPFPEPYWDFCDLHVRRDYPKCVSDAVVVEVRFGYNGYIGARRPVVHGETIPFGEEVGAHGRYVDPTVAKEFSSSAGTAAMKIFHSDAGVMSELMGPVQRECAKAWNGR